MGRRQLQSNAKCLVLCLLLCSVHSQTTVEVPEETTTLAPAEHHATTSQAVPSELTTNVSPVGSCSPGDWAHFDLAFVNRTQSKLIPIYESAADEVCEIDALLDQILPPEYEVAHSFELNSSIHVAHINETFLTVNRLLSLARNYSRTFSPLAQRIFTRFSFLLYEVNLSPGCMSSLLTIVAAAGRNEFWAMKFLDSSGLSLPSGFLEGVLSSVGDYEECLNIQSPSNAESNSSTFGGQYCWLQPVMPHPARHTYRRGDRIDNQIGLPPSMIDEVVDVLHLLEGAPFNIALCLPTTCTAAEVETALNAVLYPITKIPLRIGPKCTTKESRGTIHLDSYQKLALYTLASLLAITVLASLYECLVAGGNGAADVKEQPAANQVSIKMGELNNNNNNGNSEALGTTASSSCELTMSLSPLSIGSRLIISFSLLGNTRAMFRVSPNKFAAIDFFRFLMLLQIILMHQYYVALGWSAWPLTKRFANGLIQKAGNELKYAFLRNIHNTDFFFALSGLLLTYSSLRSLERSKGRFNYFSFAMNMYLRFYPAVFGTILFFYLLPLASDGPFWHLLDKFHIEACRKTLLESMLTYNFYLLDMETFYHNSLCNVASWWVNSCFHLILLSPLLILPLFYSSQALWLVGGVILAGSSLSAGHIWYKGIPFMTQLARMNSILEESFYSIFYTWPFIHHIGPFAAGILVGFLIRRYPKLYLGGRFGELLLTIVFVGLSALGFYWTQDMLRSSNDIASLPDGSTYEAYLNVTAGKLMFCAGFLWIFYYCCTNRSAFLNRLFRCPTLQPLYSLSLGLYLTNFIPTLFTMFSTTDVIEFTDLLIMKNFAFNFALTVILSYIIHVLFEKPMMNVLKIIESG